MRQRYYLWLNTDWKLLVVSECGGCDEPSVTSIPSVMSTPRLLSDVDDVMIPLPPDPRRGCKQGKAPLCKLLRLLSEALCDIRP